MPKGSLLDADLAPKGVPFARRLTEMGSLRPGNIRCTQGVWHIAVERDSKARRKIGKAAGEAQKRAKNEPSYRKVPLHWLIIEAGFLDFVEKRISLQSDWLFDLPTSKYDSRTKEASRRIIRRYRALGIRDEEKVFHSFRHTIKRECRSRPMKEEIADLLAGRAPTSVGQKYGAGAYLRVLQESVNMIDYHYIDWDNVIEAAKRRTAKTV